MRTRITFVKRCVPSPNKSTGHAESCTISPAKISAVGNGCRAACEWVFEQVEEAIILEDDCLPDPTFFSFCSHLLVCYRDDPRVMQISGSCFLMQPCTEKSYWFSRHSDIWGWATWRRAFRHYDASMSSWTIGGKLAAPSFGEIPSNGDIGPKIRRYTRRKDRYVGLSMALECL